MASNSMLAAKSCRCRGNRRILSDLGGGVGAGEGSDCGEALWVMVDEESPGD